MRIGIKLDETAWPIPFAERVARVRAATAAGRPAPRVVAEVVVGVTDDPAGVRAWFDDRFGFISDLPSYCAMLEREGVRDLWVVGDEAAAARELERYAAAGAADLIACPFGPPGDQERTRALLAAMARAGAAAASGHVSRSEPEGAASSPDREPRPGRRPDQSSVRRHAAQGRIPAGREGRDDGTGADRGGTDRPTADGRAATGGRARSARGVGDRRLGAAVGAAPVGGRTDVDGRRGEGPAVAGGWPPARRIPRSPAGAVDGFRRALAGSDHLTVGASRSGGARSLTPTVSGCAAVERGRRPSRFDVSGRAAL